MISGALEMLRQSWKISINLAVNGRFESLKRYEKKASSVE
jgi:hypothetical protein